MKNDKSFVDNLATLSIRFHNVNWGILDSLVDICLVIAGVICTCYYDPALMRPLLTWIASGFLIFVVIIVMTLMISALVARCRSAREQMLEDKIRYYQLQLKKAHKK